LSGKLQITNHKLQTKYKLQITKNRLVFFSLLWYSFVLKGRIIMKQIFISYCHKDEQWKKKVISHLNILLMQGELEIWEDRRLKPGEEWNPGIEKAIRSSDAAILLISRYFLASSFIINKEVPLILKQKDQGKITIIPLVVSPCLWEEFDWLKALQVRPLDGKRLSSFTRHKRNMVLKDFTKEIKAILNQKVQPVPGVESPEGEKTKQEKIKVSLSKLPTTGKDLFGRKKELEILNQAWSDPHTHVVTLVAWGGVGKTALVNHWLNMIERQDYCGAQRVYGWSFYSQGAEEGKQASADEFMQTTLAWFGDRDPKAGSGVEKGRRLAHLIRQEKTLLILDGMEPLQYPPGELHGFDGLLKDQGLKTLLKELAAAHPGLCVITTREPVTDLADKLDHSVKEILLEDLSEEAGAQLLKNLGVTGSGNEIAQAVQEYGGHALALNLLGNYLHSVHQGDIRKRDKIPALAKDRKKGRHARRVMEAYERWLGDSAELNILRIMGLFDRPVEKGALEALKGESPIMGITQKLQQLSEEDWQWALSNLRTANLLSKADPQKPGTLDCHPLIREHFGEKLKEENPEGWKQAHTRLYHYYKNLPGKKFPDTLPEMEPLFAAVAHGCAAGLHQEALADVYWQRIKRGDEHYSTAKLGAFGSDLAALSHFSQVPWSQPAPGLRDDFKAAVLNWAGFRLRAVGRLQEAIQPMKASLENVVNQKKWEDAARGSGNLSELVLSLGWVEEAVEYAGQAVTHADNSGDDFQKESKRTNLANALHHRGELEEAEKWFREAEAMQKKRQPEYRYLYSLRGFRFCDLLLGQGRHQEVRERAEQTLEWGEQFGYLLDIALDCLSLGRAWLMQTPAENTGDFTRAMDYLHQAVAGLRKSGYQDFLIKGLFARAEGYRHMQEFNAAREDLQEALEIAQLGSMNLFLADYHLEAGKLCFAQGKQTDARKHFTTAKKMMEEMGYGRKLKEVTEALGRCR
jgi:tetratricopeptide (TPR) repeat protein